MSLEILFLTFPFFFPFSRLQFLKVSDWVLLYRWWIGGFFSCSLASLSGRAKSTRIDCKTFIIVTIAVQIAKIEKVDWEMASAFQDSIQQLGWHLINSDRRLKADDPKNQKIIYQFL